MADFSQALVTLLQHEGGFVDNPNDHGNATHYGITARTLASYLKQPVSVDDVKSLPLDQACHIYEQAYWKAMNLDLIENQALATVLLDMGVLLGVSTIVKSLQGILNLFQDGLLGEHTVSSMNAYVDSRWLALELLFECELHFVDICRHDASQITFLTGWISRTHGLIELVFNEQKRGD